MKKFNRKSNLNNMTPLSFFQERRWLRSGRGQTRTWTHGPSWHTPSSLGCFSRCLTSLPDLITRLS